MPIKLKNRDVIPNRDFETITILGLDIPLTGKLPYGGQVELIDLQARHEAGEFGQFEYLMRLFCVFTLRLPKAEHVRWEWLARQDLEATEVQELTEGTLALLTHQQKVSAENPNASAPAKGKKS